MDGYSFAFEKMESRKNEAHKKEVLRIIASKCPFKDTIIDHYDEYIVCTALGPANKHSLDCNPTFECPALIRKYKDKCTKCAIINLTDFHKSKEYYLTRYDIIALQESVKHLLQEYRRLRNIEKQRNSKR